MSDSSFSDKFSLELHWKSVKYDDGKYHINGAYFSGPAIQIAEKINSNGNIILNFYAQYYGFVEKPFFSTFYWGGVEYSNINNNIIVILSDCYMVCNEESFNAMCINNEDYLLINTQDHDSDNEEFSMVYLTYVLDKFDNIRKPN